MEKIAQLAQIPANKVDEMALEKRAEFKGEALRELAKAAAPAEESIAARAEKPKEIIKEGLSEYFIYTIEGTETIHNGWSKRMRSFEGTTVPFKIQYRYRAAGVRRRNWCGCTCWPTTRSRTWAPRRCPTARSASSATTAAGT